MRFYVPEWDDAVDAGYDFVHDEFSVLQKSARPRQFIWDVFDRESTPIDGVLISREQVEGSEEKFDRLTKHGVYDDPELSIPDWLPTISDCGAWGYKSLPFPPYSNEGMLDFYESLDVDVGVTIDHLVLGNGTDQDRLYLDERYFDSTFEPDDVPERVTEGVDVMVSEWPETWPAFVDDRDPTITGHGDPPPFRANDFQGPLLVVKDRMADDPRAVYRTEDNEFRYELTLQNAREMKRCYDEEDYSFRLMAAFQGWNPESYSNAVSELLDVGYQYVGIGGVAGSSVRNVRRIVAEVGRTVTAFQREHDTRVDCHVFGFAKTDAFETVGRNGMASFDSASMLLSAWTGGNNYHLSADEKFDAIRVRYPPPGAPLSDSVETALWAQEVLAALRAYDDREPIAASIEASHNRGSIALEGLESYLRDHRHDPRYDQQYLRDVRGTFRNHYDHGRALFASFGKGFRRDLVGLLREDDAQDPVEFSEYEYLLATAADVLRTFPRTAEQVADGSEYFDGFDLVCYVLEAYVGSDLIQDRSHLEEYRRTLGARPWEDCDCPICQDLGIDVAIFRGNNRNRRRGFHNTRRFYDEFEQFLPKICILIQAGSDILGFKTVQSYLKEIAPKYWEAVHDLPVTEIGVYDANGIYEWWDDTPDRVSLDPDAIDRTLEWAGARYSSLYVYNNEDMMTPATLADAVTVLRSPAEIRKRVLVDLDYGEDWPAGLGKQSGLEEF